jgi:uncharacterized protein (DUF362 family)
MVVLCRSRTELPIVVIANTQHGLEAALESVFAPHGGVKRVVRQGGAVYVKPNGVHFAPHTHTDPAVLAALLAYLRDHNYRRLAVMEGSTGGNLTRLVFEVTGYREICRRFGARPVYLDEGPVVPVTLSDGTSVRISRHLYDELIQDAGNAYINLPKLKTHSMATVTLGVKNQQGFPIDPDRMENHSHQTLHRRLAALYQLVRPDFSLIEGLLATAHGHFPATALLEECLVPMNVLIGGVDGLAVDAVGARVLGYDVAEVAHLQLCADAGLGVADLNRIEVRGRPLAGFATRLPATLLRRFHPEVQWVVGRERACFEGCRGNSECIQELLYNDYGGRGGWTLICGAGFRQEDLEGLVGDVLIVGPCACNEVGETVRQRYPSRRIYEVPEHNDLMANTRFQARLMGVKPLSLVPYNPGRTLWLLIQARLHGLKARVPPPWG